GGSDQITVNVDTTGLPGGTVAYPGYIILTVNGQGQAVIPVSLSVLNGDVEIIVTPNPLTPQMQTGAIGVCQATTLTLVNLSEQTIFWQVRVFDTDQPYIHVDDKAEATGT